MKRFFGLVNWVLILGMVAAALWAWPRLPDQIPTHFGANGQAEVLVFFLRLQGAMDRSRKLAAGVG